jgi:type IX secretion system PorP/SprF family membrane protein
MRKILFWQILIVVIYTWPSPGLSQQSEQFSLYFLDPYISNPAYAGLDGSLSVTTGLRQQWTDLPGRPSSQLIQAHMPWYFASGAIGTQIINEQIGNGSITHFMLSYNYVWQGNEILLSGGLAGGLSMRRFNGAEWRAPEGIYGPGGIDHQDPQLSESAVNGNAPFLALGIYGIWRNLEGGLSMRQITSPAASLDPLGSFGFQNWWQAQFLYEWTLSSILSLRPSFQVRTDGIQWQSDVSAIISYNGKLFGGVSMRGFSGSTLNALIIAGGLQLNEHYQLAYAFDYTIGPLSPVAGASHEIMLRYNLNKRIGGSGLPRIIYNPRFL